jgi:hypothetical protein
VRVVTQWQVGVEDSQVKALMVADQKIKHLTKQEVVVAVQVGEVATQLILV